MYDTNLFLRKKIYDELGLFLIGAYLCISEFFISVYY